MPQDMHMEVWLIACLVQLLIDLILVIKPICYI